MVKLNPHCEVKGQELNPAIVLRGGVFGVIRIKTIRWGPMI